MAKSDRGLSWQKWLIVLVITSYMFVTTGTGVAEGIGGGLVGLVVGYGLMRVTPSFGSSDEEEEQAAD